MIFFSFENPCGCGQLRDSLVPSKSRPGQAQVPAWIKAWLAKAKTVLRDVQDQEREQREILCAESCAGSGQRAKGDCLC